MYLTEMNNICSNLAPIYMSYTAYKLYMNEKSVASEHILSIGYVIRELKEHNLLYSSRKAGLY